MSAILVIMFCLSKYTLATSLGGKMFWRYLLQQTEAKPFITAKYNTGGHNRKQGDIV